MEDKQIKEVWDSADELNTVIESMADGITLSDNKGHFEIFNSKMQELTGYNMLEANSAADFSALIYPEPDKQKEALERLNEVRQRGRGKEIETAIQAKDGSRKMLLVSTILIKYRNQDMFLTVYRDITQRKLAEEELKKAREKLEVQTWGLSKANEGIKFLYRELEQKNKELRALFDELNLRTEKEKELVAQAARVEAEKKRAKELEKAYTELKDAQEKLVRSEKLAALGELAGAVSHELRNPLGVIRNSIYFLRMKLGQALEDEKIKRHLEILEEEIGISDRIINDTLAFARIKEPRLTETETDINGVIKESLKETKKPENIKVSLQLEPDLPNILADEVQLKQVFSNIILNAIQAIPEGGELTVTSFKKDKFIEIDIIDTGTGISKENLDKIFNPLFSTKAQGTGLGLTVCQSIIEIHGGRIGVESEVGKGTKFTVRLPINENQE